VAGDPVFFDPAPLHHANLELPALVEPVSVEFEQRGPGSPLTIDLFPVPGARGSIVRLSGASRDEALQTWADIRDEGGIPLPRQDAHRYGEFDLALKPTRAGAPTKTVTVPGSKLSVQIVATDRFVVVAGRLAAATAWGQDADLRFVTRAEDPEGCPAHHEVSLRETLVELCRDFAEAHPGLVVTCDPW
jgi:hypothetical protein